MLSVVDEPRQGPDDRRAPALRYNKGKLRYDLLPAEWEAELAEILTKGAEKYDAHNWKKSIGTADHDAMVEDRYSSARRHIEAWRRGEKIDPELGTSHLGMAAWNLLVCLTYDRGKPIDRPPAPSP